MDYLKSENENATDEEPMKDIYFWNIQESGKSQSQLVEMLNDRAVSYTHLSYLNGMGVYVIAKALNQKGIPTIRGAEKWQDGVIQDLSLIHI